MKGRSLTLHLGVNNLLPRVFPLLPPLRGCDTAAFEMAACCRARGAEDVRVHVARDETRTRIVRDWFAESAARAVAGDLVVFTFAGHGILGDLVNRPSRSPAIACADGAIVSATIAEWLAAFRPGVRVVLIVDACYSGGLLTDVPAIAADVLLMAATSGDRRAPGAGKRDRVPPFTQRLLSPWPRASNGTIAGGYAGWCDVARGVLDGRWRPDRAFAAEQPLAIAGSANDRAG